MGAWVSSWGVMYGVPGPTGSGVVTGSRHPRTADNGRVTELTELTGFLAKRLDEVESRAKQALPWQTGSRYEGQPPAWVSHASFWGHPRAALNSVEADRALLALLEHEVVSGRKNGYNAPDALEQVVRIRAAVWSGHRDYRQEWAPA